MVFVGDVSIVFMGLYPIYNCGKHHLVDYKALQVFHNGLNAPETTELKIYFLTNHRSAIPEIPEVSGDITELTSPKHSMEKCHGRTMQDRAPSR